MKHGISKVATGIPLRATDPASVETFLKEKVREDLGSFKDLAIIQPVLRVDSEDADLSGNIANGFGNVMLDIRGTKVHLPFIIHQKELIPFDVIRMGDQEVTYSPESLRKIVNGIDKRSRSQAEGGSDAFEVSEIADPRKVTSGNGFLGTIMQVRDDEANRGADGSYPYEGLTFGDFDDQRITKGASQNVDVLAVFEDSVEKLAALKIIPGQEVAAYLDQVEKTAADESQKQIDAVSTVHLDSLEAAGVRRNMAKLTDDKLVDVSRAASGNNIRFPVSEFGSFEYRNGRVYHKVEPWAKNIKDRVITPIARLVVDTKMGYKILRANDNFMMTTEQPPVFDFKTQEARGLDVRAMYAMEIAADTVSHPFVVVRAQSREGNLQFISYNTPIGHLNGVAEDNPRVSSLFIEAYGCDEVMPSRDKDDQGWSSTRSFAILVARDVMLAEILHFDRVQLAEYIQINTKDADDARFTQWMSDIYSSDYYIVPQTTDFFRLEKSIEGYFQKPDGYFKEGPLVKQAAYENSNSVRLEIERDNKPRVYRVKWRYADEAEAGGASAVKQEQRALGGLSEAQAREQLAKFGFDNRQIEMFFEIAHRNGRGTNFPIPDLEKAKAIAPQDVGAKARNMAASNIAKTTLNARNFLPVFEDVLAEGVAGTVGTMFPQSTDLARKVDNWWKQSFETAVAIEKTATVMAGETWHELSALTNLKYRLDKLASDIASGSVVSGADALFEKVAELAPAIEKHAYDLIRFNRKQLLQYDKPPISPKLIKEALAELNGLYRYASFDGIRKVAEGTGLKKDKEDGESVIAAAKNGAGIGALAGGVAGLVSGMAPEQRVMENGFQLRKHYPGVKGGVLPGLGGAAIGAGVGAAASTIKKVLHKDEKTASDLVERLEKTAEEAEYTPHRTAIPVFGERLVGRPGVGAAENLLPEPVKEGVDTAINQVDDLLERLNKTASECLLGKSVAPGDEPGAPSALAKMASLFTGYNNMRKLEKADMAGFDAVLEATRREIDDIQSKLRQSHIHLRALKNQGDPDPSHTTRVQEQIQDMEQRIDNLKADLMDQGMDRADIDQRVRNRNLGFSAAVGLPSLTGASYGYEAFKNQ